jgi:acylphosphatase
MPALEILVTGRVQGVGYRYYARQLAESLAVCGEVWNRRDGAVALVAFHLDEEVLARFEQSLMNGPGRVEAVRSEPLAECPQTGFQIGPTR